MRTERVPPAVARFLLKIERRGIREAVGRVAKRTFLSD